MKFQQCCPAEQALPDFDLRHSRGSLGPALVMLPWETAVPETDRDHCRPRFPGAPGWGSSIAHHWSRFPGNSKERASPTLSADPPAPRGDCAALGLPCGS